ncbi:MAG TPA: hypothetical protein VF114_00960 [Candidatus Limnocylindria bacterium]
MTMQHPTHPDDERLAALAGDDPEVASDAALRAHVDSCDRCGPMVRELGLLRSALAELPDMVPPRPLQLLPPVAEPEAAARGGWLGRLAAPAMAAGLVLVVVGAIGTSGFNPLGMASSAGQIFQNVGENLEAGGGEGAAAEPSSGEFERPTVNDAASPSGQALSGEGSSGQPRSLYSPATSTNPEAAPPAQQGGDSAGFFQPSDPRLPWLVVLALGVGLLFAGIFLRFSRQPRAS